jgi:hypothetical protein
MNTARLAGCLVCALSAAGVVAVIVLVVAAVLS